MIRTFLRAAGPSTVGTSIGTGPGHCSMGTHSRKEQREQLSNPRRTRDFIYRLQPAERNRLREELLHFQDRTQESGESSSLTGAQIRYILFHNALPFVGFGFLDNAIMIAAGTQIELSIGVTLGISTMAAAALGNLVSDLAGLGGGSRRRLDNSAALSRGFERITHCAKLAGYVESSASKLGLAVPDLTPGQMDMWQSRLSSHMGKALGVSIGCILGMFPLLFLSDEDEKEKRNSTEPSTQS